MSAAPVSLNVAEAASESGQSVAAVKVNVHRAVKALRQRVADSERQDED